MDDGEIGLNLDSQKIQILVSEKQKSLIDTARKQKKMQPIVFSSVYLPVLMQVLQTMAEGNEDYADKKWFKAINAKCIQKKINLEKGLDVLSAAQQLFFYPIKNLNKYVWGIK